MRLSLTLTLLLAGAAQAQDMAFICEGEGWSLNISGSQARFDFPAPTVMDIPHMATAEGADWPRAMTLIGDRDTAIVILHDRICPGGTNEVQILTQRAQSPILLNGCCTETSQ